MRYLVLCFVTSLLIMGCEKDDEAVFEPVSFEFSGEYNNEEVEFIKGDSCTISLDSARAYVDERMTIEDFDYFIINEIEFYSASEVRFHVDINDSLQVFDGTTSFVDNTIVFRLEMEPGIHVIIRAFGDLESFYFIAGISGVFDPNNFDISLTQSNGALYNKSFELVDFSNEGFQLNLFYETPYIKL